MLGKFFLQLEARQNSCVIQEAQHLVMDYYTAIRIMYSTAADPAPADSVAPSRTSSPLFFYIHVSLCGDRNKTLTCVEN